MKCPYCGAADTRVVDSRPVDMDTSIRRRRECIQCEKRFTTYEVVERTPLWVIKRNGRREQFDSQKILSGLVRACAQRPVPLEKLERTVQELEQEIRQNWEKEVPTSIIGDQMLDRLGNIDDVGYIRFASVYHKFDDVDSFMRALDELRKRH